MSVSLKGCYITNIDMSIHFESFNDECASSNRERSPGRKSVEPGIKTNAG